MSRPPSDSTDVPLGTATVYLSMDDLVREPAGLGAQTLPARVEPLDATKTCIGLGPSDVLVSRRPAKPSKRPPTRRLGSASPLTRLAARVRLETRVWFVCWRLIAAGRHSLRTMLGSQRRLLSALGAVAALAVLGISRLGGSAVAPPAERAPHLAPATAATEEVTEPAAEAESASTPAPAEPPSIAHEVASMPRASLPDGTSLERAAADATAAARYDLALDLYRRLAAQHPDRRAYAAMIAACERRAAAGALRR